MEQDTVTIALSDRSRGYEISPARVPLHVLASFSKDVRDFVKGAGHDIDVNSVDVSIVEGSLAISAAHVHSQSLVSDLKMLSESPDLSRISRQRREVVRKWQSKAIRGDGYSVRIAAPWVSGNIVISSRSAFREIEGPRLVTVERYIKGELVDLGGSKESNAHIRLPDGEQLTVKTDRELIRAEANNLVYKVVHLRIRAKLDLDSGNLIDPELISFVDYKPKFDAAKFEEAVRKGRDAWADTGNPDEWVRSVRGDD